MNETAWWVVIVVATNILTAVVIIDTYRRRIYQLRRRHAAEMEANQQQIANVEMRERVLGAVPVSRLIGGKPTFPEEGVVVSRHDGAVQTMYLEGDDE